MEIHNTAEILKIGDINEPAATLTPDGLFYAKDQVTVGGGGGIILGANGEISGAMGTAGITAAGQIRPACDAEAITGVAAPTHTIAMIKLNDGRVFKLLGIEVTE